MAIRLVGFANYTTDCGYQSTCAGFNSDGSGVPGDLVVVSEGWGIHPGDSTLTVTAPSGWNMITSSMSQEGGAILAWRILDGTEPLRSLFGYQAVNPLSDYMVATYRGDHGLRVASVATNQGIDQNPLTCTITGSGEYQLVLASASDRGFITTPDYDPDYRQFEGLFTGIPDGFSGWLHFEDNDGVIASGGGFYYQFSSGGVVSFSATPNNSGGSPLNQVRPWGVAMITVVEGLETFTTGSLQEFEYFPGITSYLQQEFSYNTEIGPLTLQEFGYDYLQGSFAAHLLEDADGILPSGSGTCDLTPTIQWDAPSGSVGPFLYAWTLYSADVSGGLTIFVASGTTVNITSVTLPPLPPGVYGINVTATDRDGGTTQLGGG